MSDLTLNLDTLLEMAMNDKDEEVVQMTLKMKEQIQDYVISILKKWAKDGKDVLKENE